MQDRLLTYGGLVLRKTSLNGGISLNHVFNSIYDFTWLLLSDQIDDQFLLRNRSNSHNLNGFNSQKLSFPVRSLFIHLSILILLQIK